MKGSSNTVWLNIILRLLDTRMKSYLAPENWPTPFGESVVFLYYLKVLVLKSNLFPHLSYILFLYLETKPVMTNFSVWLVVSIETKGTPISSLVLKRLLEFKIIDLSLISYK